MTNLSIDTHRFRTGEICDDSSGVYKAVCRLLNISDEELHQRTVNYYFDHKKDDEYGWCNDAQRQTLAILNNVIICALCLKQNEENQSIVTIKFYGENPSLEKKFIYIHYNETTFNYYPLSVTNNENSNEEITKFNYNDIVKELLRIYIKDELKCGEIDFGDIGLNNILAPLDYEKTNENETLPDSVLMDGPTKRKVAELDGIPISLNNDTAVPIENSDEIPNKRLKVIEDATDRIPTFNEQKSETKKMEGLIQAVGIRDESDTEDIHENENSSSPMAMASEHHEENEPKTQCGDDIHDSEYCSILT